jgi:CRP-like cAMP-binding protein
LDETSLVSFVVTMGMIDELERHIERAEDDELGAKMRPEAKNALRAAAKMVAFGFDSIEECLMGVEIYEEAEKMYFEDGDDFPLKYISALKAVAMATEKMTDPFDGMSNELKPNKSPTSSRERPSKRKVKIQTEIRQYVKRAEDQELEKEMRQEGVDALLTAAYMLAYRKKYYDMDQGKFKVFPSVAALLVGYDIYEEAEKHYYDPEDEYPLKYVAALKEIAIADGALDEDLDHMETMAMEIGSEDDLFQVEKKKVRSVKQRMSMFEKTKSTETASDNKAAFQGQYHPLVSPPAARRKKGLNHAFNQRMSMYTQRDEEAKRKMEKLQSVRRLNERGIDKIEAGLAKDVAGKFNDQVKQYEEKFKQEIKERQSRRRRMREQKDKIRQRKKQAKSNSQTKNQVQSMAKKKKLLAAIVSYKGSEDVWANVRATSKDVDHNTYDPPKNLPKPSFQEEKSIDDAMKDSVLFHPHREVTKTRKALIHAFEKFDIKEGEEFIQRPGDNYFYVIKEGCVDFSMNGNLIGSAKKGEHFGELNLLYNDAGELETAATKPKIQKPNILAKANTTLMRLNQEVFRDIVQVQAKREEDDRKLCLKKVPFLRNLLWDGLLEKNKHTTNRLVSIMKIKKFLEGDQIIESGRDPEDSLYIVKEGKVQLTSDKMEVFHLGPGSYIGKRALMASKGKEPNIAFLQGLSKGTLFQIEKEAVNKVLGQNYFSRQFDVVQDKKKLVRWIISHFSFHSMDANLQIYSFVILQEGFQCIKSVNLDPEAMDEIAQNIEDKVFKGGKQILQEGTDTEPCLYLVREGFVTLSTKSGEFKQKVGPGGYFGVEQLLVPKDKSRPNEKSKKVLVPAQWSVSVSGSTPCVCGVLPLQDVQNVLDGEGNLDKATAKKLEDTPFEVIIEKEREIPKPKVKAGSTSTIERNKQKAKVNSAVDTDAGQMIISERLSRRRKVGNATRNLDDLEMLSVLGDGEFGEVWLVSAGNQNFALKMQLKKGQDQAEAIEREINITKDLVHPNIVEMVHRYDTDEAVYMLLGLIPGGELWELIYREDDDGNWSSGLAEPKARFYALIIADTLAYLHNEKYLYRDLKPENVMIDSDGYPVLVDFGFAKKFDDDLTFTFCGTPNYVAPEIVKNVGHNAGADHWALGVLIYEMLSGEHPFFAEGMHQMQVFEAICQDKYYPLQTDVTAASQSLIKGLLEKDRSHRLGMLAGKEGDILQHEWFSSVNLYDLRSRSVTSPWIPLKRNI